jgi:hypothetical protein
MAKVKRERAAFIEDTGWTALARLELPSGALATQAGISAISYTVHNGSTQTASGTIAVASAVFDALQGVNYADARWNADAVGYNFRFEFPASAFPSAGKDYQVEVKVTPVSGEQFHVIFAGECEAVRGS